MKKQDLYFVTSNNKKFESLSKMLTSAGVNLLRLEYDFDEGRELSIESVTKSKLKQAKQAFPDKNLSLTIVAFLFLH